MGYMQAFRGIKLAKNVVSDVRKPIHLPQPWLRYSYLPPTTPPPPILNGLCIAPGWAIPTPLHSAPSTLSYLPEAVAEGQGGGKGKELVWQICAVWRRSPHLEELLPTLSHYAEPGWEEPELEQGSVLLPPAHGGGGKAASTL